MSAIEFPEYWQRVQATLNDLLAAHRPPLPAREHKHTPEGVVIQLPPALEHVIDEIPALLARPSRR